MNRRQRRNCMRRKGAQRDRRSPVQRAADADFNRRWISLRTGSCNRFGLRGGCSSAFSAGCAAGAGAAACAGCAVGAAQPRRGLRRWRGRSEGAGCALARAQPRARVAPAEQLHADKSRGAIERDRHKQDSDQDATASTGESLAERAVVEQPLNARERLPGRAMATPMGVGAARPRIQEESGRRRYRFVPAPDQRDR